MTDQNEEDKYITELSTLSQTSYNITNNLVATQIAMALRDLGIKGEAMTLIGKVKIIDGKLVLVSLNSRVKKFLNPKYIVNKLIEEISDE
jgi:hypothetical protein